MRNNFDEGSLLQVHVSEDDLGAFAYAEVLHHPDRDVAHAFFSRELQHSAVGLDSHLGVRDHESHWVRDAQSRQLV